MKKILLPLLTLFFALFLIYPLATLLCGAFWVEVGEGAGVHRTFSLQYFYLIFENPFYRDCFTNSLVIAAGTTLACLALTLPLAQLFLRCRFPGKSTLHVLLLVPLILPPFVGAIGLKQFFARFGSLNLLLEKIGLVHDRNIPDWFGASGFAGIILLSVLHLFPILFLSVQAALAHLDPSLRDAARNLGGNGWHVFRTVTVPLAVPGIFAGSAIVFISAFTDLGTPLIFDFATTIPTQIFNLVTQADNPMGYALVVLTLLLVSALFLLGKKYGEGNYAMLGRSSAQHDNIVLSGGRGATATVAVSALVFIAVLPHLSVILQSFSAKWFLTVFPTEWSTAYYREIFSLNLTTTSLKNSLLYATLSATLDVGIGVAIAWLLAREKFAGRSLLDALAMLPLALPGLVMAFAFYVAFSRPLWPGESAAAQTVNHLWLTWFDPRQNPAPLLIMAYALHRLPYIVRAAYAGLQQTSVSLEEASANLGAKPWQTLYRITLPLIGANVVAGTIMTFSFALLDVSNGMILAQENPFYPLTKAIYTLLGRITPTAPSIACALGVLAMIFSGTALFFATRLLGQKMGRLFRA